MSLPHLVKRFFGSLVARPLAPVDRIWVENNLLPGELALWNRMTTADQVHAHAVARRAVDALGAVATRPVIAAALLHDIGKIESGLGTVGRSVATVAANIGVRHPRVVQYRAHNEIGRELLRQAGSDPLTSTWAYEHERPRSEWTVPGRVADALHKADDD